MSHNPFRARRSTEGYTTCSENATVDSEIGSRHAEQWRPGDLLIFDGIAWPQTWSRRTYQIAAYYLPLYTTADPPVALMNEPPDGDFQEAMAAFDRLIVISPRVGESCNPYPSEFRHIDNTGCVLLMGEIHLFARIPSGPPS